MILAEMLGRTFTSGTAHVEERNLVEKHTTEIQYHLSLFCGTKTVLILELNAENKLSRVRTL